MKNQTLLSLLILLLFSCNQLKQGPEGLTLLIKGNAQGTTYTVKYLATDSTDYSPQIDSILDEIDLSLSTYVDSSLISRINRNDTSALLDEFFKIVLLRSLEIAEQTGGAFDPTVAPLVNAYGFGPQGVQQPDTLAIDSLMDLIGYEQVSLDTARNKLIKQKLDIQLDFNAIAQGYSVDVLADFLSDQGIENYMVELGGEVKAHGKNNSGEWWRIGIDQPEEAAEKRELNAVISLKNKALATSGNYRKYYEKDGQKFAHTINPKTGKAVQHSLLSATVLAKDCMTADAFATAFMVLGVEESKRLLKAHPELQAFLIYDENGEYQTWFSPGLKEYIEEL